MTQWKKNEHYVQVKGSLLGPFGGRLYSSLVPLHVPVPRLIWTQGRTDAVACRGVQILRGTRMLLIPTGYVYDGPSGPTWDDKTNMRAACAHDALYMFLRAGQLGVPHSFEWKWNRETADRLLGRLMRCDGAASWRAGYYTWAVRHFAAAAAGG